RVKPSAIYCDNATNFICAAKQIKEFYEFLNQNTTKTDVLDYTAQEGIEWHFSPPCSPHFGGLLESNIKSLKIYLYKIIGNANLNYEGLYTVLTQIEMILNSRPLSPLSDDPRDYWALTPMHFILGRSATCIPETELINEPFNKLIQHFWVRWSKEVISTYQRRNKWFRDTDVDIKVGSLVLLSNSNTKPLQWPLACVVETFPSPSDGKICVATVECANGSRFKRAVNKMCVLPQC
ncbi:hypothetical protein ILUMI_20526, partial [Ignelater luminosus]